MPADPRSQHKIWRRRWQQDARCTKNITTRWKELQQTNHNIPEERNLILIYWIEHSILIPPKCTLLFLLRHVPSYIIIDMHVSHVALCPVQIIIYLSWPSCLYVYHIVYIRCYSSIINSVRFKHCSWWVALSILVALRCSWLLGKEGRKIIIPVDTWNLAWYW